MGGGGFRPTVERAHFLNTPSAGLSLRHGLLQRRERGDQIGRLLRPGNRYALELESEWGTLQRARNGAIATAGLATSPIKTVLNTSTSAFGYTAVNPHMAIFNEIWPYRSWEIHARACKLSRHDPRRRAFLMAAEGKVSLQFFTGTPIVVVVAGILVKI